ncbi:hypothetical protein FHW20_002169 [Ochrobactrum intermedium]|uniref:Uncharacterized protein n=1 Tax=Brucella intermedia TaxID=94625 RepID=A0ABR6AP50_9HYPH|nr:hypothetical protein [Brucella intermedia]MBA8851234.1 hypothetical protein [Brucella intermedia]
MAKFKVGDRVKILQRDPLGGYRVGDIFTVTGIDGAYVEFIDNDGDERSRDEDEFVPAAETTGKPDFKVGDRVRVLSDYLPWARADEIGTVEDVNARDRDCYVKFETERIGDHTWYVRWDNLELAPALTIETGKFYRTRDGRKVGPMRWVRPRLGKFCFVDETDAAWAVDGAFDIGGNPSERDLIAEWVDDPASNDNAPATKPAIVALIENGQPKPSEKPKVHISEESATDEAERLAVKYLGQKFGVFVLADSRIADVVIRRAA